MARHQITFTTEKCAISSREGLSNVSGLPELGAFSGDLSFCRCISVYNNGTFSMSWIRRALGY